MTKWADIARELVRARPGSVSVWRLLQQVEHAIMMLRAGHGRRHRYHQERMMLRDFRHKLQTRGEW